MHGGASVAEIGPSVVGQAGDVDNTGLVVETSTYKRVAVSPMFAFVWRDYLLL